MLKNNFFSFTKSKRQRYEPGWIKIKTVNLALQHLKATFHK